MYTLDSISVPSTVMQCKIIIFTPYKYAILVEIPSNGHFITSLNIILYNSTWTCYNCVLHIVFSSRDQKLLFLAVVSEEYPDQTESLVTLYLDSPL